MCSGLEIPQKHVSLDFGAQSVSVKFYVEGNVPVDIMGFVHDVDINSLLAIKRQLGESSLSESVRIKETPLRSFSFEPFDVKVHSVSL